MASLTLTHSLNTQERRPLCALVRCSWTAVNQDVNQDFFTSSTWMFCGGPAGRILHDYAKVLEKSCTLEIHDNIFNKFRRFTATEQIRPQTWWEGDILRRRSVWCLVLAGGNIKPPCRGQNQRKEAPLAFAHGCRLLKMHF